MPSPRPSTAPAASCAMPSTPPWRDVMPEDAAAAAPVEATRRRAAVRAHRAAPPRGGASRQVGPQLGPAAHRRVRAPARARPSDPQQRIALPHAGAGAVGAVCDPGSRVGYARAHRVAGDRYGLQRLRQRCDRPGDRAAAAAGGAQRGLRLAAAAGAARRHQYQRALRHRARARCGRCRRNSRATSACNGAISR